MRCSEHYKLLQLHDRGVERKKERKEKKKKSKVHRGVELTEPDVALTVFLAALT